MENMTAADRIKAALKTKTRGFRGPKREREHVELAAEDVVDVCNEILAKGPSVLAEHFLRAAQGLKPDTAVTMEADHIFELLDDLT